MVLYETCTVYYTTALIATVVLNICKSPAIVAHTILSIDLTVEEAPPSTKQAQQTRDSTSDA